MSPAPSRSVAVSQRLSHLLKVSCVAIAVVLAGGWAGASAIAPAAVERPLGAAGPDLGHYSARTISVGLQIDRDQARVLFYTLKPRPFVRPLSKDQPRTHEGGRSVQVEIALLGPSGMRYTQRVELRGVCLAHGAGEKPHIQGDTIRLHRETFVVEVPEIEGFDQVEVAYYEGDPSAPKRVVVAAETLEAEKFTPAGGSSRYGDLAFAKPGAVEAGVPGISTSGRVLWPEDFDDPDVYRIYGDPAETDKRINVVIVPDGFTYTEKYAIEADANTLVAGFRARTPYLEHDRFINYILVYAYSMESGTDQCDCSIVRDTAMSTGFPTIVSVCGSSANRGLYYGYVSPEGCDEDSSANIALAEARAPAQDATIVMVNTYRYGGAGGARAVYAAGNASATEIAVHEVGHSLGGLADEYAGDPGCGTQASEINTSASPWGAWPEWVPEIGNPWQGAEYYDLCIYRPVNFCKMRVLDAPFCPVCNQQWALSFFGSPRVSPTAPIETRSPGAGACLEVTPGVQIPFSVGVRLASGAVVTNDITWQIQGPGYPVPTTVATGTTGYTRSFGNTGIYTLSCEVVADTNFIKPSKNGANVDRVSWTIRVSTQGDPDGDGWLDSCDNCGNNYNPGQQDGDNDGAGDACDCAPANGTSFAVPVVISGLDVTDTTGGYRFTWIDQGPTAGSGTAYDIFSGGVSGLRPGGNFATGACYSDDLTTPYLDYLDAGPPAAQAFYFMIRAQNACPNGTGTYGNANRDTRAAQSATPCD